MQIVLTSGVDLSCLVCLYHGEKKNRDEWKLYCLENWLSLLIQNNEVKVKTLLYVTSCRQMSYDPW